MKSLVQATSFSKGIKFFDDGPGAYWIPEVGTKLDIERLMQHVSSVQRTFNDHPHLGDREHLERYNW